MATLSIKQRFNSIKQDKISDQAKKALQLMKEATDNFKDEEAVAKIRPKFDALFEKIKTAKPDAIKGAEPSKAPKAPTPSQTKSVRSAASTLSLTAKKRILEAKKERARQGVTTKKADILKDGKIKAIKKTGRRISQGLKGNQFKDKSEAKGNVYYEYRNNRYDKRPDSKPRLEKGGMMADGGSVQYPSDLKIGSIIKGVGFPMLKGIDDGKYYKVIEMDDFSATFVLTDEKGKRNGVKKIRHRLSSIDGGIRTVARGDNNGIEVISYSDGGMMAKGGHADMLKEDDFVWNALGKKLVVDKVTHDEYFLRGFMKPSASPFSKKKVHEYLKKGEWSLKPKMANGGEMHRVNEG